MKLLQIVGREAAGVDGARAWAGRVQAAAGGAVLALAELPRGESAEAALKRALAQAAPEVALVHLGLASPGLLMLLRERGVRFAAFLHDFAPICPTQRLWHRHGERCSGPGRTGWKCAWCVSGGQVRQAAEVPLRALLYRHRPRAWRTALAGAEALIVPSRFAREFWAEVGAPPERIAVIAPLAAAAAAAGEGAPRRVVFAGGWDEAAGAELLAAALEQVRPAVRLVVAADAVAGARWRAALPPPHELHLAPAAPWPGLDAATVVAAPARYDAPFSLAVAAAQAAGARAVATAVAGLAEQVVHGVNGFLSPPDDPGALAETLEEAFAATWDGAAVTAGAAAEAAAHLQAVQRLLELVAAGAAAPALMLEHGAWLQRRAAARGATIVDGVREFTAALRLSPAVEDGELTMRVWQTSRQHALAMNHALAFLRGCGCARVSVMPAQAPGAEEARARLRTCGVGTVAESELPDGVLELLDEEAAPDRGWLRRRFPQLKAYAGVSPAGTETFSDPGD